MGALTLSPYTIDLAPDRASVETHLAALVDSNGPEQGVREAMRYAVLGGGQRIRPILALRVARMLGAGHPLVARAAAAVELLHCASLVVDDLPCMDDSDVRRGRPSTHRLFGEATAVLASFALVSLAARTLVEPPRTPAELARLLPFQLRLLGALDSSGLIAGQALDLELEGPRRRMRREHLSDLKTVPLFTLAVQAGALFHTPRNGQREALVRFGREFGLAYQLTDDWLDGEVDDPAEVTGQLDRARAALAPFAHRARPLEELLDNLYERAFETYRRHR